MYNTKHMMRLIVSELEDATFRKKIMQNCRHCINFHLAIWPEAEWMEEEEEKLGFNDLSALYI